MNKSYSYLSTPSSSIIDPPIDSTINELPIDKLSWEDFEKLCLRVTEIQHSIDDCEIYGIKGQKQHGIDIYARKENSKYASYQCKRYKDIDEKDLEKAISEFQKNEWFLKCDEFTFCTTFSLNKTQLQDKFNVLKIELNSYGIKLIKWDKVNLCRILKSQPQIVYDFFGRDWVKIFNGKIKLNSIQSNIKLDANQVAIYRKELYKIYSTVFQQHDPSIPSHELNDFSLLLQDRFILPDAYEEKTSENLFAFNEESENCNEDINIISLDTPENRFQFQSNYSKKNKEPFFKNIIERTNIDVILPKDNKIIILGDPGSGKSTLLHYIILDLLSTEPQLINITKEWGKLLPIWLPFAYITKNLNLDQNLSLSELLRMWFKSIDKENIFDVVKYALEDKRLLLIIDGIDEWTNTSAAIQAISKIEIQSHLTNSKIVYSSRPYGYRQLKESFINISEIYIAPFSEQQQKKYIQYWYEQWMRYIKSSDPDFAKNETETFLDELKKSNDFIQLAGNPLLLSILITQRFKDSVLPKNKIKALETITDHLISRHPIRRKASASIIDEENLDFDLSEVFSELAIHIQKNYHDGVILKTEAQKIIETFLTNLMGYAIPKARKISKELLDIGANKIGIIIEKSIDEIAFMHRQFQEFMAAKYLFESDKNVTNKILEEYSNNISWNQVLTCFFGLIPNRKSKDFENYLSIIETNYPNNNKITYITFLKYGLVLNLSNSPVELAKRYLKEIVTKFEYETKSGVKSILWNIILESIYNTKIKEEVCTFLFNYFPNYYQFNDYRLKSIRNISLDIINQQQREFIFKALINGNIYQKLESSQTIKTFISDPWFYNKIIELLDICSNPEIIPFALNSIITDDFPTEIKEKNLEKYKSTEHPNIALFYFKLKINLKKINNEDLKTFIEIQRNSDVTLKEEVLNVFIEGWPKNKILLDLCLESINKHFYGKGINPENAWKILFHCFNQEEKVIKRIIDELKNEKYAFNSIGTYKGWPFILNYFRDNKTLIPEIENWIIKQEFNEPEIAYATLVGRTEMSKNFLINNLPNSNVPHWYVMALIQGWGNEIEVINKLKVYFQSGSKNTFFAAHYISIVFKDDKESGIKLLEYILFNRDLYFRDRAIKPFIDLDKDYFKINILNRFINEEIELFSKGDFSEFYNAIYTIVENYSELEIVKKYVLQKLSNDIEALELFVLYYPEQIEKINYLLVVSQPLDIEYRLKLVELFGNRHIIDEPILDQLALFPKESINFLRSTAAIAYFKYLKADHSDKIIKYCEDNAFYKGLDVDVQRQIAFSGYLITKRLSDYFQLKEENSFATPNPMFYLETSLDRVSPAMIKLLITNFEYLITEVGDDFKKLLAYSESDDQKKWSFWAKHSNIYSPSYPFILKYINLNIDKIDNQNIIDFIKRTSPRSILLKKLALENLNSNNEQLAIFSGQILGENFNHDIKIYEVVSKIDNYYSCSGKIIALCIGWPNSDILKTIFNDVVENEIHINQLVGYYLKFLLRDVKNIMEFFESVFENYNDVKYVHQYFINPLLERMKRDEELQITLKEKLLKSNSSTEKVSFYSILNSINKIDQDIIDWKELQISDYKSDNYGYNIMNNKINDLSEILTEIYY